MGFLCVGLIAIYSFGRLGFSQYPLPSIQSTYSSVQNFIFLRGNYLYTIK